MVVEGEPQYVVNKIIDLDWYHGHLQYKVQYKDYGKEHDKWLFRDDMLEDFEEGTLQDYEDEFYKEHPKAPKLGEPPVRRRTSGRTPKI